MLKRYFIWIACIASLFFTSCEKDNSGSDPNREYVNNWIYDEMSFYYLWNFYIPNQPDNTLKPEQFFESLLYKRGEVIGDRFSWMQENYAELLGSLNGVTSYDVGFEYTGYLMSPGSNEVIGQIAYVKPNTDAERIGLRRGDYFTKINGTTLNTSNWSKLLSSNGRSIKITFLDINTGETTNKTIQKAVNYAEDPVFFNKVFRLNGHKIGYLVYNFFAPGPTEDNYDYDKKLNDVFGTFKSEGITELILDLRYNSGGSLNSAILLGSMIAPELSPDDVFIKLEFNPLLQAELVEEYGEEEALLNKLRDKLYTGEEINNVGASIRKLYVLTSNSTASASELVINGLKPYMPGNIFLIGNTTVGKNVGSISIYEENNPKNKWGMQPIILRYFNKDGKADFLNGFQPDIVEKDNADKLPLGDQNEQMLQIAINHIINNSVSSGLRSGVDNGNELLGSSVQRKAWANKTIVDNPLLKRRNVKRQ